MPIYGTALLSLCLLTGLTVGRLIGAALGVDADIGGVGIAMILLIVGCDALQRRGPMKAPTERHRFGARCICPSWSRWQRARMCSEHFRAVMAIVAGLAAVAASFVLVAVLAKSGSKEEKDS